MTYVTLHNAGVNVSTPSISSSSSSLRRNANLSHLHLFANGSIELSGVRMNTGLCLFQKQLQITEERAANCSRDKWSRKHKMNTKLLMFMSCYSNCIFYEMSWRQQLMFLPGPAPVVVSANGPGAKWILFCRACVTFECYFVIFSLCFSWKT